MIDIAQHAYRELAGVLTWDPNPFGEVPHAWYFVTTQWLQTWGSDIAQMIIACALWLFSNQIAARCMACSNPDTCLNCGYPNHHINTDHCPECGQTWSTNDGKTMENATRNSSETRAICAAGVRLLGVLLIATQAARTVYELVMHLYMGAVFEYPLECLKELFLFDSLIYIWAPPMISLTIAALLWFNNKRIAHMLLPKL